MSKTTREQLETLINDHRKSPNKRKHIVSADKEKLFRQLNMIYDKDAQKEIQKELGVDIEKFDLGNCSAYVHFKRLTSVYYRNMYNKFFVPIWAAAMNEDHTVGYILYPRLTPLREVLQDLRGAELDFKAYVKEVNKILRLCIPSIGLALDALHTEVPGRRTMYYHRDVCLDNIYISVRKIVDKHRYETVVYDDARLKLTEVTRGSQQEFIDTNVTFSSGSRFRQYHHHPDLKKGSSQYHRRHDWNSYSVYILEVLHLLHPMPHKKDFKQITDYVDFATDYRDHIEHLKMNDEYKKYILQYLRIAVECLKLKRTVELVTSYKMPKSMTGASDTFTYYFEYGVSSWTAELVWIYETSRPDKYKTFFQQQKVKLCQACLLHCVDKLQTKIHSSSDRAKCGEDCVYYCPRCYRNGERKFCTNKHGTTSSIIGGHSSYALLLYGEEFKDPKNSDVCERSAQMVGNTLRHPQICGIPKKNILNRPLFGVRESEEDDTFLSAADALQQHCEEMRDLMHGEHSITCNNDANYNLYVFYCGHGRDKEHPGDWCPTKTEDITKDVRDAHLKTLWQCTKSVKHKQIACKASCVLVSYFMGHCYTEVEHPSYIVNSRLSKTYTSVATEVDTVLTGPEGGLPDIIPWLCQLFRSAYHERCDGRKKSDGCLVKTGKTDVCTQLKARISDVCEDAYIDSVCLSIHAQHMHINCGYNSTVDVDVKNGKRVPIAYYNSTGVDLKVISFTEGQKHEVELDFEVKWTVAEIKKAIAQELDASSAQICLLTSNSDGYSRYDLVCDHNIDDCLCSSDLLYHVISNPVEVTLRAIDVDGTGQVVEETITLPLDDADLDPLIGECSEPGDCGPRKSPLPNIIRQTVHHLKHQLGDDKTGGTTPSDNKDQITAPSVKDRFIGKLRGSTVDTQRMAGADWLEIDEMAQRYVHEEGNDFIVRRPPNTTYKLDIEWTSEFSPELSEGRIASVDRENIAVVAVVAEDTFDEETSHPEDDMPALESIDDAMEASGDDVVEISDDDVMEASGDDVMEASGDDVMEASGDDVMEASDDDVMEASDDDVIEISDDDVIEVSDDDLIEAPNAVIETLDGDIAHVAAADDPAMEDGLRSNAPQDVVAHQVTSDDTTDTNPAADTSDEVPVAVSSSPED